MAATINDKFSKVSTGVRPLTTTVDGTRATAGGTLSCADLTGWDTDTAVHGVTYKVDGQGAIVAGSQLDFKGIVSGNTITNFTVTGGTDAGNAVGDIVQATPTAAWAKDLADGLIVSHDQDGTLKAGAVDNAAVLASNVVTTVKILDANVTTAKIADANITYAKLLSTIFSGERLSYTNTGDGGGTGYYVNLGGIKICWGISGATSIPSAVTRNISLPSSFFTTIQYSSVVPGGGTAVVYMQLGGAVTTTNIPVYVTPSTTGDVSIQWLVIGT